MRGVDVCAIARSIAIGRARRRRARWIGARTTPRDAMSTAADAAVDDAAMRDATRRDDAAAACATTIATTKTLDRATLGAALEARDAMRVSKILDAIERTEGLACAPTLRAMVDVFAHGTLRDYRARAEGENLPTLTTREETKLKRLTTCALCAEGGTIAYERLMRELEFTNERAMETFIVDECLGQIVWGRLDPKNKVLTVRRATARDARANALDAVIADVSRWHAISETMLANLNEQIARVSSEKAESLAREDEINAAMEETKKQLAAAEPDDVERDDDDEDMDEDGPSTGVKRRR
jgi:COP9 signalosome complex subunit 7